MTDTLEDDTNSVFVIYVPPGKEKTVESCIRLGTGPGPSKMATADEVQTYNHAVAGLQTLSDLSSSTHFPNSGIALITPGTINLIGTKGVNISSATSFSNSTTGSSYNITQTPSGNVISASYLNNELGTWATTSYNQAASVAVTFAPLQASIGFVPSYSVSGPLTLTNNWGAMWNSAVGFSVTAELGRVTNFGWHTIVATSTDGSSNQYYTAKQAQSTAKGFSWTVPVAGKSYKAYDASQATWCRIVELAAVATDAIATAYALSGAIQANKPHTTPADVQSWLKAAEPIAIVCTALDGLLCVGGILLGALFVDKQAKASNPDNWYSTAINIGDGSIELTTATPKQEKEPPDPPPDPPPPDPPPTTPNLKVDRKDGITLTTGSGASAEQIATTGISANVQAMSITMTTGPGASITLTTGQGASITMTGNTVTIDATTTTIKGLLKCPGPDAPGTPTTPSSPPAPTIYSAPTTPQSIGLSGDGNTPGQQVPVNWGAPNWPPSKP